MIIVPSQGVGKFFGVKDFTPVDMKTHIYRVGEGWSYRVIARSQGKTKVVFAPKPYPFTWRTAWRMASLWWTPNPDYPGALRADGTRVPLQLAQG